MLIGLRLLAGPLGFLLLLQTNPCGPLNLDGSALTAAVAAHILVIEGERQLSFPGVHGLTWLVPSDSCSFLFLRKAVQEDGQELLPFCVAVIAFEIPSECRSIQSVRLAGESGVATRTAIWFRQGYARAGRRERHERVPPRQRPILHRYLLRPHLLRERR